MISCANPATEDIRYVMALLTDTQEGNVLDGVAPHFGSFPALSPGTLEACCGRATWPTEFYAQRGLGNWKLRWFQPTNNPQLVYVGQLKARFHCYPGRLELAVVAPPGPQSPGTLEALSQGAEKAQASTFVSRQSLNSEPRPTK